MIKFPVDEKGSGEAEAKKAAFAQAMAWADSQPLPLPSTTRIREELKEVLESVRKWAAATKGSPGPDDGARRLVLAFFNQRLPDLHAALESFCSCADQVRDADPDANLGRVLGHWTTTAPEARVLQHIIFVYVVIAAKALEEQELAAAPVARKFMKEVARVQSAHRRLKRWLDVDHDDGAGGAAFMPGIRDRLRQSLEDVTGEPVELPLGKVGPGPVAIALDRARCNLVAALGAIEEQTANAIKSIGASFSTIELGVGKNGRPKRVGQKRRVWMLAEAGIPRAAIGRFEGLTEDAVMSILKRIRREMRTQVEQPRPSPGAGRAQPSQ